MRHFIFCSLLLRIIDRMGRMFWLYGSIFTGCYRVHLYGSNHLPFHRFFRLASLWRLLTIRQNDTSDNHREVFLKVLIVFDENSFADQDVFNNVLDAGITFTAKNGNNVLFVFFGKMENKNDGLGVISSSVTVNDNVVRFGVGSREILLELQLHWLIFILILQILLDNYYKLYAMIQLYFLVRVNLLKAIS